jgi:hypothetical protein
VLRLVRHASRATQPPGTCTAAAAKRLHADLPGGPNAASLTPSSISMLDGSTVLGSAAPLTHS